jgi:plasmid stability protein
MAQVIVRNLEDDIKLALKQRASLHGWSMEEEVRCILRRAVNEESTVTSQLGSRIAARFADIGLAEPLPELRGQSVEPMSFGT